jgi:hypothetical protein
MMPLMSGCEGRFATTFPDFALGFLFGGKHATFRYGVGAGAATYVSE